jgi:hypothetical protein
MSINLEKRTITHYINGMSNPLTEAAECNGPLALVSDVMQGDGEEADECWTIVHIQTGLQLAGPYWNRSIALACMTECLQVVDPWLWNFDLHSPEHSANMLVIRPTLRRIINGYNDQDAYFWPVEDEPRLSD